jgi:hypothetical protein
MPAAGVAARESAAVMAAAHVTAVIPAAHMAAVVAARSAIVVAAIVVATLTLAAGWQVAVVTMWPLRPICLVRPGRRPPAGAL